MKHTDMHQERAPLALRMASERGAIGVYVAIACLVPMGFTMFVVDYGILQTSRHQAQNSADAGALAGAVALAFDDFADRSNSGAAKQAAYNPAQEHVELLRVPDSGIQPQAVVDTDGTIHLVYLGQHASANNLYYVTRSPGETRWSEPRRVNSNAGSAPQNSATTQAQIARGPDGRLHVVWFDPGGWLPPPGRSTPRIHYTRTNDDHSAFEPQRHLVRQHARGVATGASVVADQHGNVFVAWHAGDGEEAGRAVFLIRSRDGGATFGPERRISPEGRGACQCCGLRALVEPRHGTIHVSYRTAAGNVNRDMTLLTSTDGGESFVPSTMHTWQLHACPASTTAMTSGSDVPLVAWETRGQVYVARTNRLTEPWSPPNDGQRRQKHPSLAASENGAVLLAWGEGPGSQPGGDLRWQLFDARGNPTAHGRTAEEIPYESTPATVSLPGGRFAVIF